MIAKSHFKTFLMIWIDAHVFFTDMKIRMNQRVNYHPRFLSPSPSPM